MYIHPLYNVDTNTVNYLSVSSIVCPNIDNIWFIVELLNVNTIQ